MAYRALADLVLVGHLLFIRYIVFGGLAVRWRRWTAFVHVPCALYGTAIELGGWICPLTPLENHLRRLGGERGYAGGFIEHYLVPIVYPHALTHRAQIVLGILVAAWSIAVYAWALQLRAREPPPGGGGGDPRRSGGASSPS